MAEVGRPLKYTVEQFDKLVNNYFESCFDYVYKKMTKKEYKKESKKDVPPSGFYFEKEIDANGNYIKEQITPFSILGLCEFIGTTRETLREYEDREEFVDTIKKAKQKIERYVEEESLKGKLNPTVSIFNLKNNFGWKDKTEVDLGNKDNKPFNVDLTSLTIEEIRELLKDEDKE